MMKIRLFEDVDYPIIREWWKGHGWSPVPTQILPKLGVIADSKKEDVAAAWLYQDNSIGLCWTEWFVSNPKSSGFQVAKAHNAIMKFLKKFAEDNNYSIMMTSCRQQSLVRLYEKSGFVMTDTNVTHLMSVLTPKGQE